MGRRRKKIEDERIKEADTEIKNALKNKSYVVEPTVEKCRCGRGTLWLIMEFKTHSLWGCSEITCKNITKKD